MSYQRMITQMYLSNKIIINVCIPYIKIYNKIIIITISFVVSDNGGELILPLWGSYPGGNLS